MFHQLLWDAGQLAVVSPGDLRMVKYAVLSQIDYDDCRQNTKAYVKGEGFLP